MSAGTATVSVVASLGDGERRLSVTERSVVDRALRMLGVSRSGQARRLSGGRSGALVVALDDSLVLKVTTAREQLAQAAIELEVVADTRVQERRLAPIFRAGDYGDETVCLLTTQCRPLPLAATLDERHWANIGRRLAEVHGTPLPLGAGLRGKPEVTDEALANAVEQWRQRGQGPSAERAAETVASLLGAPIDQALVLTHGDCHLDNVVLDEDGLVRWIDWHEAHLGNGFDDLMFLCQRAEFAGTFVPREPLLAGYALAKGLGCDEAFSRACWAAELTLLLVEWPPFLSYGTPDRQSVMAGRLTWLNAALR